MSGKIREYHTGARHRTGQEGLFCKSGSGGIDARSSTTAGIATDVIKCYIGTDGVIQESTTTLTVINPFGSAVEADTYITVKRVAGHWVVDAEDCGA